VSVLQGGWCTWLLTTPALNLKRVCGVLSAELAEYEDECGSIRDALWFCDLNTTPDGEQIDARERIAEIKERYGPDHQRVHSSPGLRRSCSQR
jgi:hypothetical protein